MQYGHCVVKATPSAISSLNFFGIAPSLSAAASKAAKAAIASGASSLSDFIFFRFAMSYMVVPSIGMQVANQPADILGRVQLTANLGQYSCPRCVARRQSRE